MNQEEFAACFLRCYEQLLQVAQRRGAAEPEDVVQQLFVDLLRVGQQGKPRFHWVPRDNPSSYLAVCVLNKIISDGRCRRNAPAALLTDVPAPQKRPPGENAAEELQRMYLRLHPIVEGLSSTERRALLAKLNGQPRTEAALTLGLPQTQYDQALYRARRTLRESVPRRLFEENLSKTLDILLQLLQSA